MKDEGNGLQSVCVCSEWSDHSGDCDSLCNRPAYLEEEFRYSQHTRGVSQHKEVNRFEGKVKSDTLTGLRRGMQVHFLEHSPLAVAIKVEKDILFLRTII